MKRPVTVTIDEDLFKQVTEDNTIKLSRRVEDLLYKGLMYETSSSKDMFSQLLHIVKKLNDDRKNGLIVFKERESGTGGDIE